MDQAEVLEPPLVSPALYSFGAIEGFEVSLVMELLLRLLATLALFLVGSPFSDLLVPYLLLPYLLALGLLPRFLRLTARRA
jgi:hypothetical protein